MTSVVYKSDGTPVYIPDSSIFQGFNNQSANINKGIGIQITGQDAGGYVGPFAQTLIQMTENFASPTVLSDSTTLQGQLWFEKTSDSTGNLFVKTSTISSGIANWQQIVTGATGVTAGSYTNSNITVDSLGRITSASNGSSGSAGTVTSVGLTGSTDVIVTGASPITTSGTFSLSMSDTGVTAGTYGSTTQVPVVVVDAKGRITGISVESISAPLSEPALQIVYGTGSGVTSNSNLTYDSTLNTLSIGTTLPGNIASQPGQPLSLSSDVSLTFATNGSDRLSISSTGAILVNSTAGSAGQVLMSNGANSPPSWQSSTAQPAGTNAQIQFNNSGAFAGTPKITYNQTHNLLNLTAANETVIDLGTLGSSLTQSLDVSQSNNFRCTIGAPIEFTFVGAQDKDPWPTISMVSSITVFMQQDSVGNNQPTWPSGIYWQNGTVPAASVTPNVIDIYTFLTYTGGRSWIGIQVAKGLQIAV